MVRVKSSQKFFTEDEISSLTGICTDHLRNLAKEKHLGTSALASIGGVRAESRLFTNSDLMVLTVLQARCQH
jgi:hypothetical protein